MCCKIQKNTHKTSWPYKWVCNVPFLCPAKLWHNHLHVLKESSLTTTVWVHLCIRPLEHRGWTCFPSTKKKKRKKKSASNNSSMNRTGPHSFTTVSHHSSHEWNHRGAECQDTRALLFVFSLNCCMALCDFRHHQGSPCWELLCKCSTSFDLVYSLCTDVLWCWDWWE